MSTTCHSEQSEESRLKISRCARNDSSGAPFKQKEKMMGDITIRIPQQIHIEYKLKNVRLAKRILNLLNTMIFRDDAFAEQQADSPLRLGDLALQYFGPDGGVELELPHHPPHQPLQFGL